jgi:hypothetical protein
MNSITLAIIQFVFGKFLSAAGGKAGSEIGDAILGMILGTSSDISSQIQAQIQQLQTAVASLPTQTATEELYLNAHTNLHSAISNADTILNFTDGQQTDPARLAAVSTGQWQAIVGFVTPGIGNDYSSLTNTLLYTAYNAEVQNIIDSIPYNPSQATNYYAYQMNLPLLAKNPLYLGDYVNAHTALFISVLSDIAAVANAAAAAFQAVQTIYNERVSLNRSSARYPSLSKTTSAPCSKPTPRKICP